MSDKDSSDSTSPHYRITIKDPEGPDLRRAALGIMMGKGRNQFSCQKCGALVTVSKKKAEKLRKMNKPKVLCKRCKKVRKARQRR